MSEINSEQFNTFFEQVHVAVLPNDEAHVHIDAFGQTFGMLMGLALTSGLIQTGDSIAVGELDEGLTEVRDEILTALGDDSIKDALDTLFGAFITVETLVNEAIASGKITPPSAPASTSMTGDPALDEILAAVGPQVMDAEYLDALLASGQVIVIRPEDLDNLDALFGSAEDDEPQA